MILITGAGGKTGRALIKALSKVENVCTFIHREEQDSTVKSLGAERIIVGDLHDEPAIRAAMEGVRAIYHICPNMSPDEAVIGNSVIREAQKARVEHFVYHSVLHPHIEVMHHHWQKMRVEEMLFESGLPFTILQPAPYMQNLLSGWKSIVEEGILRVPYSIDAKFSFLDLDDFAEAAKIVLTGHNHKNVIYELAGTPPTSYAEVAEVIERALNRKIRAEKEEVGRFAGRLRAKGMSDYALENLARMFEYYDRWGLAGNPNVLRWILKREPASLQLFIERVVTDDSIPTSR